MDQAAMTRFINDQKAAKQNSLQGTAAKTSADVQPSRHTSAARMSIAPVGNVQAPSSLPPQQGPVPQQIMAQRSASNPIASVNQQARPPIDLEKLDRDIAVEDLLRSPQVQEAVARKKLQDHFRLRSGIPPTQGDETTADRVMGLLQRYVE